MLSLTKKEFFIQLIIPIYYSTILIKFFWADQGSVISLLCSLLFIGIGFGSLFVFFLKLNKRSLIFNLIPIIILLTIPVILLSKNYRVEDVLLIYQYFGIALIPFLFKLNHTIYTTFNYLIIIMFLYFILSGTLPDDVFGVSRNFISVILLIGTGYQIIAAVQNNKNPSILLILLSLFVAVWAVGRSGILVYTLLLIIYPLISNYKVIYKFLIIGCITCVAIYVYNTFSEDLFATAIYRIENMGGGDVREEMNKEYLDKTLSSPFNILIGTDLREIESLRSVEYNPHNSFIRLHIYYGLFGLLIIGTLIINGLAQYFFKREYIYLILFLALLLRSSVDSTAFHGPLDPLMFYFILIPIKRVFLFERKEE